MAVGNVPMIASTQALLKEMLYKVYCHRRVTYLSVEWGHVPVDLHFIKSIAQLGKRGFLSPLEVCIATKVSELRDGVDC